MDGTIIFIDEVDAVAGARDTGAEMHEATRRILSVVLQRIEGFKGKGKSLLVCATNRKEDLDSALISRFDLSILYDLPDSDTRQAIFRLYAKQFSSTASSLKILAERTAGLSCRDIKEICEHAERRWASKWIREKRLQPGAAIKQKEQSEGGELTGQAELCGPPELAVYLECIKFRLLGIRSSTIS